MVAVSPKSPLRIRTVGTFQRNALGGPPRSFVVNEKERLIPAVADVRNNDGPSKDPPNWLSFS